MSLFDKKLSKTIVKNIKYQDVIVKRYERQGKEE